MEVRKMKIVEKNIDELVMYENNPRKNDEAVKYVAESISQFGFKVPVIIDKDNVIVAGHTRVKAAKKLKLKTVPCIVADDLTPEQIKAFRLADNKVSELSDWDEDLLNDELDDICNIDMTVFGFDDLETNMVDGDKEIVEDDVPSVPEKPITQYGDVWLMGGHRLLCGDSTKAEEVLRLMNGEKADMVFTDPPYGVSIGDKNKMLNSVQKAGRCTENIANDNISTSELYNILVKAMINCRENCKDTAVYFVTSPQGGELGLMMMMMMKDAGLPVRHMIIWEKNCATFSLGRLDYDYQHEPIFYTWTKSHNNYRNGEYRTTIWKYDKPRKCDLHPTMKPVALVANCLKDGSKENDIVLDMFGGSGTTLIAAEQLNRRARLMELDPHYCDVIVKRWEKLTGCKAELQRK